MNKITGVIIGVVVFVGIVGFLFLDKKEAALFDITLTNYNGEIVQLQDFIGTPLVINSWAAWCPFCVKELSDFVTAQKEFGDTVVIIAVNRGESLKTAREYTDDLNISEDLVFLMDPDDKFYKNIGGFSMPETIFVDETGVTKIHKRGFMSLEEMQEKINDLLSVKEDGL